MLVAAIFSALPRHSPNAAEVFLPSASSARLVGQCLQCRVILPATSTTFFMSCHPAPLHFYPSPLASTQHVGQGFPLDWFTHTFNWLSVGMSALAFLVAPMAMAAYNLGGGLHGPFKLSLALVVINALQLLSWRRDASKTCPGFADTTRLFSHAWGRLAGGGKVAWIACAQGSFEAVMFMFAFLWVPLLGSANGLDVDSIQVRGFFPWGIAFAQQLVCVMIGSGLFKLGSSLVAYATEERLLLWACIVGEACFVGLYLKATPGLVQCSLLGFEVCVGVYLNAMGVIRSKYVPQEVRHGARLCPPLPATCGLLRDTRCFTASSI